MIIKTFFPILIVLITVLDLAGQNDWKFKKDKDGIKVYFRENTTSDLKELKISLDVEASLSTIVAALDDVPTIPKWVYKCTKAYRIKTISPTQYYYYNELDFPWPLSNRDLVAYTTLEQNPATKVVTSVSKGMPSFVEEEKDLVRLPELEIKWIFTPKSDGKVHIDYYLKSNPGGAIPTWVVNMAVDYGPTQSMEGFRNILKKEKYKNVNLPHIIN